MASGSHYIMHAGHWLSVALCPLICTLELAESFEKHAWAHGCMDGTDQLITDLVSWDLDSGPWAIGPSIQHTEHSARITHHTQCNQVACSVLSTQHPQATSCKFNFGHCDIVKLFMICAVSLHDTCMHAQLQMRKYIWHMAILN